MPTSSLASRRHACSRFSPASTKPADTEYRPVLRHALLCCSSRRSSWSTIAVITAGSTLGNSSRLPSASLVHRCAHPPNAGSVGAPHVGQWRWRACHTPSEIAVVAWPASRALACGANPRRSTQSNRSAAFSNSDFDVFASGSRCSSNASSAPICSLLAVTGSAAFTRDTSTATTCSSRLPPYEPRNMASAVGCVCNSAAT